MNMEAYGEAQIVPMVCWKNMSSYGNDCWLGCLGIIVWCLVEGSFREGVLYCF